jgi:hypothetical protein
MFTIVATRSGMADKGYIHGSTYKLNVNGSMISRFDGSGGEISYKSLRSFLSDWSSIHVLGDVSMMRNPSSSGNRNSPIEH